MAVLAVPAFSDITFTSMGPFYGTASIAGHITGTFYSGFLHFTDPSNTCGLGAAFNTICVDLDHEINSGSHWGVTCSDSGTLASNLQRAGHIIAKYYSTITTNDQANGLQLAAWEAVYDNGATPNFTDNASGGNFRVHNAPAAAINYAATFYNDGSNFAGNCVYMKPFDHSGGQAQMAPTPEPASIAALALGAIMVIRRRKRL